MRYIGIDAHKTLLQVAITDEKGRLLEEFSTPTDPPGLKRLLARLRPTDAVLLEATTNAFTLHDILSPKVKQVAVSNPIKTKVIAEARIKTDKIDARTLAHLLRLNAFYPVWVPPVEVRKKRTLVSLYYQSQNTATRMKNRLHAVLHANLIQSQVKDLFSLAGRAWLQALSLPPDDRFEVDLCLQMLHGAEQAQARIVRRIETEALKDPQVLRLLQIPGLSLLSAFILLAEIGDIARFSHPGKLASYAGLVPSLHQSNQKTYTGRITKAGRRFLRWILIQCANVAVLHAPQFQPFYSRLRNKKGHNLAVTAVARKLLTVVWHLLARQEPYQNLDGRKYIHKLMEAAWRVGKEDYPGGAKQAVQEGLALLGLDYPTEEDRPLSLNALRKNPEIHARLSSLKPPRRRYVLPPAPVEADRPPCGRQASHRSLGKALRAFPQLPQANIAVSHDL